ncbi:hypothetical protein AB0L06_10810 [Spirillospora sp. NPDC052269]
MISFENLHATDLLRLCPEAQTWGRAEVLRHTAEIMCHVEAEVKIFERDDTIFAEQDVPVVLLATELAAWRRVAERLRSDYRSSDLQGLEEGAVLIRSDGERWCLGSVFAPDGWTRPMSGGDLAALVDSFVQQVISRSRVELGLDLAPLFGG